MQIAQALYTLASPVTIIASLILFTAGALLYNLYNYLPPPFPSSSPALVSGRVPVLGALRFFTARWDFFRSAAAHSTTGNFSFNLGKYQVIGISGDEGRKFVFDTKLLNFSEGYGVLFGQAPPQRDNTDDPHMQKGFAAYFSKRITQMMKSENLGHNLHKYFHDMRYQLDHIASTSRNNITQPFDSIYEIVFQLTMRTVGCDDIAEDPATLTKVLHMYEGIEKSATPATLMFPSLPWPAVISRYWSGFKMYMIFKRISDERKRTGKKRDDCLQFLLDQGDDTANVISFVQGALFAGQLNSGINAAYVITCLARYPEWRQRCREELAQVAGRYAKDPSSPLLDQLEQVPLHVWESGFTINDLCLKESIRLQLLGSVLRRNVSGEDIEIPNSAAKSPTGKPEIIPNGAVVTYHVAEVHNNPDIYKDPEIWDPSRYMEGREEDKKREYAWLGWGAGRHPCLGMRFAKLEQNLIIAFFLAKFDFWLVDKNGQTTETLPRIDVNAHSARKPADKTYVKFEVIGR
ncbi:MAG: hypothetical protein M1828_004043 [Chrysothrix sp. TS-e1954]|nr:MAG: hypothetical protein M1828_004043 [Chrysothrix sp. TS-e1954]